MKTGIQGLNILNIPAGVYARLRSGTGMTQRGSNWMKQQTSPAIVLRRTNYGEADRIVTFLTPIGKVKAMVKGVRRSKSKLAGGIELFSESTITFMYTRGDLARIVSTRLDTHWDGIVGDLQKMMFGYEAMKQIDKHIEDEADRDYYDLLKATLEGLADSEIPLATMQVWFYSRLLLIEGAQINTAEDSNGKKLSAEELYNFSPDSMGFVKAKNGRYKPDDIKLLRLMIQHQPTTLKQVKNLAEHSKTLKDLFTLELTQFMK